ncbi:hypothetical protein [Halomonas sp. AOP42-D1-22]|uniref:hypothetical protein n=1 Tax=Halomonas sp. AOP42-D1-22 TaxID=3457667 RepID=UPI0040345D3C
MAATRPIPAKGIGTSEACHYVRLAGSVSAARLETAPAPTGRDGELTDSVFEPVVIEADIAMDSHGGCTIHSDYVEPKSAITLAAEFRRVLLDEGELVPERMTRYTVGEGRYVMLDQESAKRTANHLKLAVSNVTEGVEVVHCGPHWALWSDDVITTKTGLPAWVKAIKSLSDDAEEIITMFRGSDSARLHVPLKAVLNLQAIINRSTETLTHDGGIYAPKKVERLNVQLHSGSAETWWLHTAGYVEGYAFDLYASKDALLNDVFPSPPATAVPAYTPMTGQLWEPCVSCGSEPVYMPLHRCEQCWPKPC